MRTGAPKLAPKVRFGCRSEEHTSELQSLRHVVCRLLLEKQFNVSSELEKMLEATGTYDLLTIVLQISDMIYVLYRVHKEPRRVGQSLLAVFFFLGIGPPPTLPLFPTTALFG